MKPFKNQRGMIDIVLILVVFVMAAALGGYVYYRQQQANKTYNAAGSGATVTKHTKAASSAHSSDLIPVTTAVKTETISGGYFVNSTWGVRFKLTSDISDLTYSNRDASTIDFSSEALTDAGKGTTTNYCDASNGALGSLVRANPADQEGGSTAKDYPGAVLIGGKDYLFVSSQDTCSNPSNSTTNALQLKLMQSLKTAIQTTIQATP